MKKILFIVSFISIIILGSTLVVGEDMIKEISALLDDSLNFNVDGEPWQPEDVDGSKMTPILYNNRTYIPVRALLEHKGAGVDYEAETRTVILDFTTIEQEPVAGRDLDKASPMLMERVAKSKDEEDDLGDQAISDLVIRKNPDFDSDIPMDMTYDFELQDSTKVYLNDRLVEGNFLRGDVGKVFENMSKVQLAFDEDESISAVYLYDDLDSDDDGIDDGSETQLKDIVITIEIGDLKIVITIRT